MLGFLAPRAIPGVERIADDCYMRAIELDGAFGTISVMPSRRGTSLVATVRFPQVTALPEILARIRRIFDLAADPLAIAAQLAEDPVMAPLVTTRPGLRVPGAWDGFELAVRAILGQQITVTAAKRLAGKLVAAYGTPLEPELASPDLKHTFPRPERLPAPISRRSACPPHAPARYPRWRRHLPPILGFSPLARASKHASSGSLLSPASASGRPATSLCAPCASRTPSPPPILASRARSPTAAAQG
jgi:AraC family transcriptional regulator, regulatory protein of adaptative response / DNA-3-methyladenine glycosylase II